jgi:Phage integrase family
MVSKKCLIVRSGKTYRYVIDKATTFCLTLQAVFGNPWDDDARTDRLKSETLHLLSITARQMSGSQRWSWFFQKSLKRPAANSVYLTVCWMLAELKLDSAGVLAGFRQMEARRHASALRMRGEFDAGGFSGFCNDVMHTRYSTRTVQSIVTTCARTAGIKKRVYPHLLRHSIATILLDSGLVPIDQLQKFLGHLDLSTTQIYAETSLQALGNNYIRALGGMRSSPPAPAPAPSR